MRRAVAGIPGSLLQGKKDGEWDGNGSGRNPKAPCGKWEWGLGWDRELEWGWEWGWEWSGSGVGAAGTPRFLVGIRLGLEAAGTPASPHGGGATRRLMLLVGNGVRMEAARKKWPGGRSLACGDGVELGPARR